MKVATPLLRAIDLASGQGSFAIRGKGDKITVTLSVAKLPPSIATPLGLFLEDGVGAATYTSVGSIDTLGKGKGKKVFASTMGVPNELGPSDLEALVGLHVEVRDALGVTLLGAAVPELTKFEGVKAKGVLEVAPGSPIPNAKAKLKTSSSASKGSETFSLKVKPLDPSITYSLFVEDATQPGEFLDAGALVSGLFLSNTAHGDPLPLGVGTLSELIGLTLEVRDDEGTPVVTGVFPGSAPDGSLWPKYAVLTLGAPGGSDNRYLRLLSFAAPIYRKNLDETSVSIAELVEEGDAQWRIDSYGPAKDGVVCTVRLASDDRAWWTVHQTADVSGHVQHYLAVYLGNDDPEDLESSQFILHAKPKVGGHSAYSFESVKFPGEFLHDLGHALTANGVLIAGGDGDTFVLR